jgi:hypothetical protein
MTKRQMILGVFSGLLLLGVGAAYAAEGARAEAQKHYRVGVVALKHDDLDTAVGEFQKAAELEVVLHLW